MKRIPRVAADHWLTGSITSYKNNPLGFLQSNAQKHGDIYQFRIAHQIYNVVNRPEYVQHVLQKNQKNYKRHYAYRVLTLLVGKGVLTTDGEAWKEARRRLQPHFHKKNILSYFEIIDQQARQMTTTWKDKKKVLLLSEMTRITLSIISDCFLGGSEPKSPEIVEKNLPYALETVLDRIQSPIQPPLWVPTKKHRLFKEKLRNIEALITKIIKKKEQEGNFYEPDLISMFLLMEREGEYISKQQIFDEIITIFAAGHETTANALFSLIKHIQEHPDVEQKVRDEFDAVTGHTPLTVEHLPNLKYVNKVINESLRLSTPVWSIGREAILDDHIDGFKIKKGQNVLLSPYLIHRNPELWQNPEKFDPDRFDQPLKHKYAYFPFGGGPKLCIGMGLALMEMQVILYHILKADFRMDLERSKDIPFETSLTLRAKKDIELTENNSKKVLGTVY